MPSPSHPSPPNLKETSAEAKHKEEVTSTTPPPLIAKKSSMPSPSHPSPPNLKETSAEEAKPFQENVSVKININKSVDNNKNKNNNKNTDPTEPERVISFVKEEEQLYKRAEAS